ncbi:tetratricopeptide repeat protein [Desulfobacter curvatus]|uniref:tetratricopeptide repeat protein n=1 Tax=Desulfobacter curvatus TaxID=2290 RepID=UPI000368CB98|nr:hypothetical protein [Desulfobacter curvatus]
MNAIDKHYLSLQFKLKIYSKNGTEFQSFFENIMDKAFDDFRKIPSGGGDGGNDGWIRKLGQYFQVYAPNVPATKDSEAAKKLKEDFEKLKRNWNQVQEIKEYYFVYNDKYAGANKPEEALAELREKNPNIQFELFLSKNLENIFFQLDEAKILCLGFSIDQRVAISNGFEFLKKVEIELDREHAKYAQKRLEDVENIISTLNDNELILEYKILECRCLQKLEKIEEAINNYYKISRMYPNDSRALLYLSEIHLAQYEPEKNEQLLEKARKIDTHFWLLKLEELIRKNNLDEEIDVSNIDKEVFPVSPREKSSFYSVFSSFFEKTGNHAQAENYIEKAIRCNPDKFINYIFKLSLTINKIFSNHETSQRSEDSQKLLQDICELEAKFGEYGDIGARNKALLNATRLNIYRLIQNTPEYERVAQETFELSLTCHLDRQIQDVLVSFLHIVSLPEKDLNRLFEFLSSFGCKLSKELSTVIVFQCNIQNKLFTVGKKFFQDKGNQGFYQFIADIENGNDDEVLNFLQNNIQLSFIMAQ